MGNSFLVNNFRLLRGIKFKIELDERTGAYFVNVGPLNPESAERYIELLKRQITETYMTFDYG